MITERAAIGSRTVAACAVLALLTWFGGLALAARMIEPTEAVIVIAGSRSSALVAAGAADVAFLDASNPFVLVAGRSKGFVKDLYAAGAWLVLPATNGGCRSPRQLQL